MSAATTVPQAKSVHVELDPAVALAAYARHRRRFAASVVGLDREALAGPSRCSDWTVADVLRHGCDVDARLTSVWAGERSLSRFDPRVTPHQGVLASRPIPDEEVRDRFVASAEVMASEVGGSGAERWGVPSLSPAGPVPWWMSALHGFYDSWVHERDVFVPLGATVPAEADEVPAVLAWQLGIVGLIGGPVDAVVAGMRVTAGEVPVRVAPSAARDGVAVLDGDPAAICDALSGRGALGDVLSGDPAVVERLRALAIFFASPV